MQHFCADTVHDSKGNIGSILGGVDMDPERPFAEGRELCRPLSFLTLTY